MTTTHPAPCGEYPRRTDDDALALATETARRNGRGTVVGATSSASASAVGGGARGSNVSESLKRQCVRRRSSSTISWRGAQPDLARPSPSVVRRPFTESEPEPGS